MTVTVQGGARKTVEVKIVSTNIIRGFWMRTLTNDANGVLLMGAGSSLGVSGGATLISTTSTGGTVPKGVSNLTFTANRYLGTDPNVDPLSTPALETCSAHFKVTAN
jgi:hypothetical protein